MTKGLEQTGNLQPPEPTMTAEEYTKKLRRVEEEERLAKLAQQAKLDAQVADREGRNDSMFPVPEVVAEQDVPPPEGTRTLKPLVKVSKVPITKEALAHFYADDPYNR